MTPRRTKVTTVSSPAIRCAIYTRKSTAEGLQQDFNSLDAQREAAEAYIASVPSRKFGDVFSSSSYPASLTG